MQLSYVENMKVITDLPRYELRVLHDQPKDNYLIVLCPRLEDWVLKTAQEANIDVEIYGLPHDAEKLRRVINSNLDKFERLVRDLKDCSKMKTLTNLLKGKK